jgi:polar amino acid transport system substrate-binding protein
MKKQLVPFLMICACLCLGVSMLRSADVAGAPAPTLVPPTLVPTPDSSAASESLLSESTVARLQKDGVVRIGLLYNAPPFGELNIRGDVTGYDADLARSMADAWGVKFEPVQVTRQTAIDMLKNGSVDLLVAAQVHYRDLDRHVEFSETYYPSSESVLLRNDDGAAQLAHMDGRKIGVVMGTPAEGAVADWQARTGINITVTQYLTLDQAFNALLAKEIDGVVDTHIRLTRIIPAPGAAKILDEPVSPEPYAVVMRRQDVNFRNLVNRTLQYLVKKGRMDEIQKAYFPGSKYPPNRVPLWNGLGDDAPKPGQFGADVPYPAQYAVPRIQNAKVVRVAGVTDLPTDAQESEKRLDTVNRAVIEAMARRWGVQVQYIPNSAANAVDLIASGEADLAVGVPLDWGVADKVDFTAPYFLHGDRLLVKKDTDQETFNTLRGKIVGVFGSEPGAADKVNKLADSVQTAVRIFTVVREQDAAFTLLQDNNADVIFGDSLKLMAHVQANPDALRLGTRGDAPDPWYSRVYVSVAVPRNDIDFRLLVEYTLQEMARDGSWQGLLGQVMLPEDIYPMDIWPGSSDYLGFSLKAR